MGYELRYPIQATYIKTVAELATKAHTYEALEQERLKKNNYHGYENPLTIEG